MTDWDGDLRLFGWGCLTIALEDGVESNCPVTVTGLCSVVGSGSVSCLPGNARWSSCYGTMHVLVLPTARAAHRVPVRRRYSCGPPAHRARASSPSFSPNCQSDDEATAGAG